MEKTILGKTIYRSKIDWWLLLILIGMLVIWLTVLEPNMRWFGIIMGSAMTAFIVVIIRGCWYEIDGNDLVVYQFFRPTRLPIAKIIKVKKTKGYLATAGMSHLRVSISFNDRSVLKSYAPLEISPDDRDGFIAHLKEINPNIEV